MILGEFLLLVGGLRYALGSWGQPINNSYASVSQW